VKFIQVLVGKPDEKDNLEDSGVNGRIILRWIFSGIWGHGLDQSGSGEGQVAGTCECGNEAWDFIICGEFFD
jgi:hypothetical protein